MAATFDEAARRVEAELKRLIAVMNDEIVPAIRQDSSKALRVVAEQLQKLAEALERSKTEPR